MKPLLLLLLLGIFSAKAQLQTEPKKFIQVTGSAEMSVKPDEIELQITLSEYYDGDYKNNKNKNEEDEENDKNRKKIRLDYIDSEFGKILKKNNIDPKSILYDGTSSWYWWYWWSYRNNYLQTKTITLKLNKETNFLKLVEDLNTKWTQKIEISNTTNKEIQRLRKEVKIEAIKAAKAKAAYLLESVNEEIGSLLEIEEMPEETNHWYGRQNLISNAIISNSSGQDSGVENVSDIKLRYEVRAKFQIK